MSAKALEEKGLILLMGNVYGVSSLYPMGSGSIVISTSGWLSTLVLAHFPNVLIPTWLKAGESEFKLQKNPSSACSASTSGLGVFGISSKLAASFVPVSSFSHFLPLLQTAVRCPFRLHLEQVTLEPLQAFLQSFPSCQRSPQYLHFFLLFSAFTDPIQPGRSCYSTTVKLSCFNGNC